VRGLVAVSSLICIGLKLWWQMEGGGWRIKHKIGQRDGLWVVEAGGAHRRQAAVAHV
jgi:hypothetical protein